MCRTRSCECIGTIQIIGPGSGRAYNVLECKSDACGGVSSPSPCPRPLIGNDPRLLSRPPWKHLDSHSHFDQLTVSDGAMHCWHRSGVARHKIVLFTCLSPSGACCDSRLRILIKIEIYAICTFHSCSVRAGFADNASVHSPPTLTFHSGALVLSLIYIECKGGCFLHDLCRATEKADMTTTTH